ncbi:SGNH/GDSL hydrolase family protein [Derxia gummosa]|uniref:SGNH/GDSL hydrolase family protein n=1 Tax=Derxia gummosa DSM 723 TaxID=1121388 RepID=A0A8B6X3Q2_9BURK|nr:SGNH/GDSL hydrolase family protein [Derxia gummosa]
MQLDHRPVIYRFEGYPLQPDKGLDSLDDPARLRLLCEGDSWFSVGALPVTSNLLMGLRFWRETLLVSLARPGDTLLNMSDLSANPQLRLLIADRKFQSKWDAILLSGGGNDLIDRADRIICKPGPGAGGSMHDYIDSAELADFRADLQAGYRAIAALRAGSKNENTPIVTHVYDYPTPRDAPVKFFGFATPSGPWLYRALKFREVPERLWATISDHLFETLASTLAELGDRRRPDAIPNFHVVKATRNTLTRAALHTTGPDGDWENEIHPTPAGYDKLGQVISAELAVLLGGV